MTTKVQEREHVNAWVEPEVVRRLDERALAADRSRSAEIRVALREHVGRVVADEEGEEA